tara:strand:- start:295 stop:1374 length:1080 start_codon:yes stop_codon:yes gene_type:complete
MEIKVRALDDVGEKSTAQVEEELLQKHEDKFEDSTSNEQVVVEQPQEEVQGLTEDQVLSHIKERYNKEFTSMDDIFEERETQEELPEDVAAYFKYKKETGRSIKDYVELQRNYDDASPESLLRDYLKTTETALDDDDIQSLMDEYSYDEDLDDESQIKKIKVAKKKAIAKAKNYFTEQQEMYKQPLESSGSGVSEGEKKQYESYKQYLNEAATQQEETKRRSEWFTQKTEEVFNNDFKGFDFKIGEDQITFSPGNAEETKKLHQSPMTFVNKYLDDSGLMKDAAGYHKALAAAMNPDKFAQYFYEQGKANATEDVMRKTKNINMTTRNTPEVSSKSGTQFKSLGNDSGRGLKIRSIKRK